MKTIMVTGGAGFIGSCLVRYLIGKQQTRVINFDCLTYAGNLDSLQSVASDPLYSFVEEDIRRGDVVADALREFEPAAIVNLAAESHVDRSIDGPAAFVETNVVGTFTLLDAARAYWRDLPSDRAEQFRFLHVSTDEVYGSMASDESAAESTRYAPNSPYSASKAASDHFARAYFHTYGLPVLVTNCSNNYGPHQFPEKLIPLMILNAVEGKPLPVYGDGKNVRDWLYVEDHVAALVTVLNSGQPGQVYNIGGNCERTNLQIVNAICEIVDRLVPDLPTRPCSELIKFVTDRPGHDRRYAIDSSKIQRELGWKPSVDFESGLERTVRWYLDNSAWVERITSGVYQRERLGLVQEDSTA